MKTYYLVPAGQLPHQIPDGYGGECHWIDLDSHGAAGAGHHVLVTVDSGHPVPATWQEMPHLLDASTTLEKHGKGHHAKLTDVGVLGAHTMFGAAQQLAKTVAAFRP